PALVQAEYFFNTDPGPGLATPLLTPLLGDTALSLTNHPLVVPPISFVGGPAGNSNRKVSSTLSQVSGYVQDQIKLGAGFELIGGLRYDRLRLAVTSGFAAEAGHHQHRAQQDQAVDAAEGDAPASRAAFFVQRFTGQVDQDVAGRIGGLRGVQVRIGHGQCYSAATGSWVRNQRSS
ncbi:MAG: TonB-dependent receptor, partial [Betaproteobacteria bacterium]|nr:TonB-dependent receptor [Betaproteobacteria bacterium]